MSLDDETIYILEDSDVKHNFNIGYFLIAVTNEVKQINKNLEKIANKDFNINTNNYTTSVPNINKINEIIRDHTIIGSNNTKFNKPSYVDKNIISD